MFLGFKLLKFWAFRLLDFWSLEMDFFGPLGFWAIRGQLYETNTEIMVYIPTSIVNTLHPSEVSPSRSPCSYTFTASPIFFHPWYTEPHDDEGDCHNIHIVKSEVSTDHSTSHKCHTY